MVIALTDLVVEQDGGAVIISHSTGVCRAIAIDTSGLLIWRLINGHRTVEDIVHSFLKHWDGVQCEALQVRQDVERFLDGLETQGCLSYLTAAAGGKEPQLG